MQGDRGPWAMMAVPRRTSRPCFFRRLLGFPNKEGNCPRQPLPPPAFEDGQKEGNPPNDEVPLHAAPVVRPELGSGKATPGAAQAVSGEYEFFSRAGT